MEEEGHAAADRRTGTIVVRRGNRPPERAVDANLRPDEVRHAAGKLSPSVTRWLCCRRPKATPDEVLVKLPLPSGLQRQSHGPVQPEVEKRFCGNAHISSLVQDFDARPAGRAN